MSKSDFSGLEELMRDTQKLAEDTDRFLEDFILDMALRALARTKGRTPTGIYDRPVSFVTKTGKQVAFTPHTGKTGGTMKAGWKISKVYHRGDKLRVLLFNMTEYAEYVEIGHRTKGGASWWEGYHMATISVNEIQEQVPRRLGPAWAAFCAERLKG